MRFVWRMAWRETRASWSRLLFFFVCVALGVAAIVALRSLVQNVRTTLTREARSLVGADLVVQSMRPWTDEVRARLDELLHAPGVLGTTDVVETSTMAAPLAPDGGGAVRLVELRAVEGAFPFYGALELADGRVYSHALLTHHGALVQPELLSALGLKVGDSVKLAGQAFVIRGTVTRDRVQRAGGFAFGPRVYVDLADLKTTSLLDYGSRATREVFVRVDAQGLSRLEQRARDLFRRDLVTVRSWQSVQDRLGRNLTLAENYLSLVGFAIVVLGGIGVWSVTRVFVQQKIKSVAILKCLGATSGQVLATYVVQILWLAAAGSTFGIAIAAAAVAAIPTKMLTPLGVNHVGITASAAGQGFAVGLLVSLLFALVPLLEVRRVKPLLLLRADTTATARRRDWQSGLAGASMLAALVLVAIWQAGSLRAGLFVSVGLAVVGVALLATSRALVWAIVPLARSKRFALRHAVISLGRPGNQTRVILMAVGLGCFFILAVRAVQTNLIDAFRLEIGPNAPDLVLIDIQPDEVDGLPGVVAPYLRSPPRLLPIMRARVVGVDGHRVNLPTPDDIRRQGELTREYGLTFRDTLSDNERLVAGVFWPGPLAQAHTSDGADTEVSIEQGIHDHGGVDVGDLMRFDVAGRVLHARVTSIRKVTWDEAENGGFMFVFRPGPAIDRTPHTFIGFLQTVVDPAARGALERDVVKRYPNVSIVDVKDVLATLQEVVANATLGVTIVGAVTLVGGGLILIGAVAMTKFQRVYDAAIYRTLGASTRLLASMVAIEYGLLGCLSGLVGAGGALALSWLVATRLFEIDWHPVPGALSIGVGLTTVLVGVVGLAASVDVLLTKPLRTLRSE
jgi:putative ABC transport system permease protein